MILALQQGAISRSPRVADIARNGECLNMAQTGVQDALCVESAGTLDKVDG